jgi:hypothetical protein
MMIQAASFINGQLDDLFGTWGQADLTKNDPIASTNNKFYGATNFVQFNAEIGKHFGGDTLPFPYEAKEQMFRTNIVVLEALGFFLSEAQNLPGSLCELIKPISVVHLFVTPLSLAEGGTEPSVSLR